MSSNNPTMQPNTSASVDGQSTNAQFSLQYTVEGGGKYASGLSQWTTVLNIQGGASPRASIFVSRYNGDLIGRPVGLFSETLSPAKARQLVDRFDAVALSASPKSARVDVGGRSPRLYYQHASLSITTGFEPKDQNFLNALAPAMSELNALMTELLTNPELALNVSVEQFQNGGNGLRLRLRLTNVGSGEVIVSDPRMVSLESPEPRGFLQVTPWPSNVPGEIGRPPSWQRIALEPPPPATPDEGLKIGPKESLTFPAVAWAAPRPGSFIAQAVWQDYYGPAKIDPSRVQPAVPKDASFSDRPFVIRGAAFSSYLRVEVAGK